MEELVGLKIGIIVVCKKMTDVLLCSSSVTPLIPKSANNSVTFDFEKPL